MRIALAVAIFCFLRSGYGQECLPDNFKGKIGAHKYNRVTVKGDTYEEARGKLQLEIPKAGFLQQIKQSKVSVLTGDSFKQKVYQHKKLKANVDMFKEYACKKNGEFYITAIWAKEGVRYINMTHPRGLNMRNVVKMCGLSKVTIFASMDNDFVYKAESVWQIHFKNPNNKKRSIYPFWYVLCGQSHLKMNRKRRAGRLYWTYNKGNEFDNFRFIVSGSEVEDKSIEMWLHLNKDL